tara:strand:- start:210 stop:440 length:231 start_codon:yes stop_codon:yes gene_type:complete
MPEDVLDVLNVKELRCEKLGVAATPAVSALSLGATNWTTIASIDADSATNAQLGDAIGMILKVLHENGMMQGSVTA